MSFGDGAPPGPAKELKRSLTVARRRCGNIGRRKRRREGGKKKKGGEAAQPRSFLLASQPFVRSAPKLRNELLCVRNGHRRSQGCTGCTCTPRGEKMGSNLQGKIVSAPSQAESAPPPRQSKSSIFDEIGEN